MSVRAVLFDLDDTLLEYSADVARHWASACALAAAEGIDCAALAAAVEDRRAWFWSDPARHAAHRTDMRDAWRRIAVAALERIGRPHASLAETIAADFAARRWAAMRLFPDAVPCLEALRGRGLRVGLVTNGDAGMQRDKLARFALAPHFDALVIEGELGVGKPDPRAFRHVLDALGVAAADALMVGNDLAFDVAGAQDAGLRAVWLDRAGDGVPRGARVRPDRVVRTLDALR